MALFFHLSRIIRASALNDIPSPAIDAEKNPGARRNLHDQRSMGRDSGVNRADERLRAEGHHDRQSEAETKNHYRSDESTGSVESSSVR